MQAFRSLLRPDEKTGAAMRWAHRVWVFLWLTAFGLGIGLLSLYLTANSYAGIDAQALLCEAPYVRVLAFDEMGRAVLRQAKKAGGLPLVNAGQTPPDTAYGALERRCAALYGLFAAQPELCPEQIARVYRK